MGVPCGVLDAFVVLNSVEVAPVSLERGEIGVRGALRLRTSRLSETPGSLEVSEDGAITCGPSVS